MTLPRSSPLTVLSHYVRLTLLEDRRRQLFGRGEIDILLEKVRAHNALNGFRFIAVEFGVIALVLAPFAVYYWAAGRWALAFISTGIIANCLPIVFAALRSLRAGEPGSRSDRLRDRIRARRRSDQLHADMDTITIALCTLVPFLGAALITVDQLRTPRATGES